MKAKYDSDEIELSQAYVEALKQVLIAEVEMMRAAEPESADCWYWGRACIGDLAEGHSVGFYYGSEQDIPDDGLGQFAVTVEEVRYEIHL